MLMVGFATVVDLVDAAGVVRFISFSFIEKFGNPDAYRDTAYNADGKRHCEQWEPPPFGSRHPFDVCQPCGQK